MSGIFPDLELFRSRIVAELDNLRIWAEDAPLTDRVNQTPPASGSVLSADAVPHGDEHSTTRLEILSPPMGDLAAGTAWLADLPLSPPGAIGAAPAPLETFAHGHDDNRLETEVAFLLDAAPAGLGSPGTTGTLIILNAAFIPGWPFPDALVRDTLPSRRTEPALAALSDNMSAMSEAERTEYLAQLGIPFQLPARLRTLLDRMFDPKVPRGVLLAFLEALAVLAEGLARFDAELTAHRAARERLAAAMPRHPGGKTRLEV